MGRRRGNKKGLCRPVGVIGFCRCGQKLWNNGQEGPDVTVSRLINGFPPPSVSSATISEIFGVIHSNFS